MWGNRSLRGLGFSISTLNLAGGISTIVIPLIILERLGGTEAAVGVVFALSGVAGVDLGGPVRPDRFAAPGVAAAGHPDGTHGAGGTPDAARRDPDRHRARAGSRSPCHCYSTAPLNGPMDIGLFTMRQRRTDPSMLGRAFAVSMAFNFLGYPIGAAIGGVLATTSLDAAIWLGVAAFVATVFAVVLIPRQDDGYRDAPVTGDPASASAG